MRQLLLKVFLIYLVIQEIAILFFGNIGLDIFQYENPRLISIVLFVIGSLIVSMKEYYLTTTKDRLIINGIIIAVLSAIYIYKAQDVFEGMIITDTKEHAQ